MRSEKTSGYPGRRHGSAPESVTATYSRSNEANTHPASKPSKSSSLATASTPPQARHLRELRNPAEHLLPLAKLREFLATNQVLPIHLEELQQRGILGAYIDPLGNILACNDQCRTALPGIEHVGSSIPAWLFTPSAKETLIEWEHEASRMVAVLKTTFGRYRSSEQVRHLARRLRPNHEVDQLWSASTNVAYGRDADHPVRWRNPTTKKPRSCILTVSDVAQRHNVLLLTAVHTR